MSNTTTKPSWVGFKKSSRSNNETDCVEVHHTLGKIRDSKDPAKTEVDGDAAALVAAVKAGIV
ncbi:DUF397 domain-containing protein [Amycolatopsis sp. NPDC003865]